LKTFVYFFRLSVQQAPFLSFPVPKIPDGEWTDLKFNPDTTQILICTSGKSVFVVDAYVGGVLHTLTVMILPQRKFFFHVKEKNERKMNK
jgi:hypothetical protein